MPEASEIHGAREPGDVVLTALEAGYRSGDGLEVAPLGIPPDGGLQLDCGGSLADSLYECPGHDDTPPGLNLDRSLPHCLVFLLSHTPPHVLLNDGDQGVEFPGTEGFESGQHSSSKEDLRETILVFFVVVNGLLQDQRTQLLELKVLDHGKPVRGRNEHVVSWENDLSSTSGS
jgi:hypothetical protein